MVAAEEIEDQEVLKGEIYVLTSSGYITAIFFT